MRAECNPHEHPDVVHKDVMNLVRFLRELLLKIASTALAEQALLAGHCLACSIRRARAQCSACLGP
jgi:hypothetical protein